MPKSSTWCYVGQKFLGPMQHQVARRKSRLLLLNIGTVTGLEQPRGGFTKIYSFVYTFALQGAENGPRGVRCNLA